MSYPYGKKRELRTTTTSTCDVPSLFTSSGMSTSGVPSLFASSSNSKYRRNIADIKRIDKEKLVAKKTSYGDIDIGNKIVANNADLKGFGKTLKNVKKEDVAIQPGALRKHKMIAELSNSYKDRGLGNKSDPIPRSSNSYLNRKFAKTKFKVTNPDRPKVNILALVDGAIEDGPTSEAIQKASAEKVAASAPIPAAPKPRGYSNFSASKKAPGSTSEQKSPSSSTLKDVLSISGPEKPTRASSFVQKKNPTPESMDRSSISIANGRKEEPNAINCSSATPAWKARLQKQEKTVPITLKITDEIAKNETLDDDAACQSREDEHCVMRGKSTIVARTQKPIRSKSILATIDKCMVSDTKETDITTNMTGITSSKGLFKSNKSTLSEESPNDIQKETCNSLAKLYYHPSACNYSKDLIDSSTSSLADARESITKNIITVPKKSTEEKEQKKKKENKKKKKEKKDSLAKDLVTEELEGSSDIGKNIDSIFSPTRTYDFVPRERGETEFLQSPTSDDVNLARLRKELEETKKQIENVGLISKQEISELEKEFRNTKETVRFQFMKSIHAQEQQNEELFEEYQEVVDEKQREIDEFRLANQRLRATVAKLPKQIADVKISNSDLMKANEDIAGHIEDLQKFAKKLKMDQKRLIESSDKCKNDYLPRYRHQLWERQEYVNAEIKIKNLYRDCVIKATKRIEKSRQPDLIEKIAMMVLQTEGEVNPKFDPKFLFANDDSSDDDSSCSSYSDSDTDSASDSD